MLHRDAVSARSRIRTRSVQGFVGSGTGSKDSFCSSEWSVGLVDRKGKIPLPTGDREELRDGVGMGGEIWKNTNSVQLENKLFLVTRETSSASIPHGSVPSHPSGPPSPLETSVSTLTPDPCFQPSAPAPHP